TWSLFLPQDRAAPAAANLAAIGHGLRLDILEQAFTAALAADAGLLHAAERGDGRGAGAGVVATMAEAQLRNDAAGAVIIVGEDVGGEPEFRGVGPFDRLLFAGEADHRHQRAEGLFLAAAHVLG